MWNPLLTNCQCNLCKAQYLTPYCQAKWIEKGHQKVDCFLVSGLNFWGQVSNVVTCSLTFWCVCVIGGHGASVTGLLLANASATFIFSLLNPLTIIIRTDKLLNSFRASKSKSRIQSLHKHCKCIFNNAVINASALACSGNMCMLRDNKKNIWMRAIKQRPGLWHFYFTHWKF